MPPEPRTFVANAGQSGLTVLAALRQWLPGASWSAVRKLLAGRHVALNGSLCLDEARRIKAGETLTLYGAELPPPPSGNDVRLVWLDRDVIVADKPAGMMTLRHLAERNWTRTRKQRQPALDDLLPELVARREPSAAARRGQFEAVYSVHRIDRETSGLIAFARTSESRQNLIGQFERHAVERTYLAIAQGNVSTRTFESYLVVDRGDGKRGSTTAKGEGKRALTHVRRLERIAGDTLLECRLETGRTHQIRIHLSEAGHPLVGDLKYGQAPSETANKIGRPRLALHAATLGFDHPMTGERLRFESPLPPDFLRLLAGLRREAN